MLVTPGKKFRIAIIFGIQLNYVQHSFDVMSFRETVLLIVPIYFGVAISDTDFQKLLEPLYLQ